MSDTSFDDLFSDFNVNTNEINSLQSTSYVSSSSSSYNTILHPTTTNNNIPHLESTAHEVLNHNTFIFPLEQQPNTIDHHEVIKRNIYTIVVIFIS